MTLLSICNDVLDDVGLARVTVVAGNTDDTARKLFAAAKQAGKELARAHNWDVLVKEHTFSTVADQEDYSLPVDYDHLVDGSLWDRTNYEEMRGGLSPRQWQIYKSSTLATSATIWKQFRVRSVSGTVQFSIFPTPASVDSLVFEYVSKYWNKTSGDAGQSTWMNDSDEPIVDEYLLILGTKWRLLERLGLDYAQAMRDYDRQLAIKKARDSGGAQTISLSKDYVTIRGNIPDTGFGQ